MKQTIKFFLLSCIIGASLASIFFLSIKSKAEAKTLSSVYVFQVGVFKNLTNAENFKTQYYFAKILKDKELYRVLIGATLSNKDLLEKNFKDQGYDYYIKTINVSDNVLNNIKKYDELLRQTKQENQKLIIKKILESLPDEL